MKIYTGIDQGSADWFRLRLGIPTASCFDQIVTPKRCDLSQSAVKYAYRLCAEKLLNEPSESFEGQMWMERGRELEPQAVKQYEFVNDVETAAVSFITTDDGLIGCSPDRIVVAERRIGLEIKCPSPHVHLSYLLDDRPEKYMPQVQGQIMVAELERAHLYAYHPRMPDALWETAPDGAYIAKLAEALKQFNERLFAMLERARALGVFQASPAVLAPVEREESGEIDAAFRYESQRLFPPEGALE